MSEIPKAYEPQSVETKWYQYWLERKFFVADPARVSPQRPAYSIVIPPPNVTGVLHMGHVLNNTIQDILARKARMDGKEVLWLPGTDHAGIATEGMVAKQIRKEEKKTKQDIGREEFLRRVWAWKERHGGIIIEQLKKLGCSCDWSRERFTMDPDYVRCVQKVFVELYKKGLIYRGKRMVNWCPATQTALSDEEVEMKPQKGFMYLFRVEVAESTSASSPRPSPPSDGGEGARRAGEEGTVAPGPVTDSEGRTWLTIATTRPETIPGDTAVAVNPKDTRYAHLIGQYVIRPLPVQLPREQKLIPIIGDEQVDFEFGTGVLKVTPAHDKADFEIGQRHHLPLRDIMHPDGTMNDLAGQSLAGLDRFEARAVAVERLKEIGALVKEEPYEHNVGFSQRADVPIEPRLSEQWFLKYPSVDKAKACVAGSTGLWPVPPGNSPGGTGGASPTQTGAVGKGGVPVVPVGGSPVPPGASKMRFHPDRWAKVYDHWLTNIQDWCISRQLWWGHRIPAWHRVHVLPGHHRPGEGYAIETCVGIEPPDNSGNWKQDEDVLDTWFSSWLWPFATMGWTGDESHDSNNPTLQAFYPTTDLVTGPDIIFFWVARMIMAGYEFMGEMPFRNVYFTGIIRDKQGRKMSKTLGNSPDPLALIAKYGADALRFGTMRSAPLGQDVLFDEKDVELGRNFCNKLWNACRFRQMQGGSARGAAKILDQIDPNRLSSDDKWILLKLDQAIRELTEALAEYKFNEATQTLYRFFWSEYCDWYVEASKAALTRPSEATTPSPLNGLRTKSRRENSSILAEVRGETNQEGSPASTASNAAPHLTPTLSLPTGSGEGDPRRANTLAVIDLVLSHTLRLFHPFLPFITEELWQAMGYHQDLPPDQGGQTIMSAPWPKAFDAEFRARYSLDDCYLDYVATKYELVTLGRNLRREVNLPANKKVKYVLKPATSVPPNDVAVLRLLLNAEALEINPDYQPPKGTPTVHSPMGELYLPLEGLIDVAAEKARLTKELEKIRAEIEKVEQKLNNPAFVQKVPPHVLEEHRKRLAEWQAKLQHAQSAWAALG